MQNLQMNHLSKLCLFIGDIIFPPSPNAVTIRNVSSLLPNYTVSRFGDIITCCSYQPVVVRAAIHEAKYHNNRKAIKLLAELLNQRLQDQPHSVIIPVPLARARLRERGHNQVESIIRSSSVIKEKHQLETKILKRQTNTKPQTTLSREERLKNVQNAFVVKNPEIVTGKNIILIDDVATTGATLGAARKALEVYRPRSVTCMALTH